MAQLSLEDICRQLESVKPGLGTAVGEFVKDCLSRRGIYRGEGAKKSVSLRGHYVLSMKFEFCKIYPNGMLDMSYVLHFAEKAGDISIGEDYLAAFAELVPEGAGWGNIPYKFSIGDVLPRYSDEWLALIDKTLARFRHRG